MLGLLTTIGFCSLMCSIIACAIGFKTVAVIMLLICIATNLGMIKIVKE